MAHRLPRGSNDSKKRVRKKARSASEALSSFSPAEFQTAVQDSGFTAPIPRRPRVAFGNVELTAPRVHDGAVTSFQDAVAHSPCRRAQE